MNKHPMHKADRQLSPEDTLAILTDEPRGVLSVIGDDGYPYAVPINYIVVNDKVYLHSAPYGYKMECLEKSKKCCFSVIVSAQIIPSKITAAFESVIITGDVAMVTDEAEKRAALEAFVTQKHPGYEEIGLKMVNTLFDKTALLRIDPKEMTGKAYKG